ncbi:carboxypeptidase regulatory-like domain-containing protein [Mucilaginibacter sp.]|uniref:carboxypeptidase regulatory-like domain-containing protein n=1 Tax=Mucilaginibacter sp. TaxID=1882438 RepID=UPI003D0D3492
MKNSLLLFILLFPITVLAQYGVSGRIISQADTKPVANASVFLSNTTIGGKTGADGSFKLLNVKPGKYELVVSVVGFDNFTQTLTVNSSDLNLADITIYPKVIALNEVTVKPNTDPNRQRNYDWFKDEFLGKTALARECRIVNPEVLDLEYNERSGVLTASAVDFLIIRNNALGYNIKYLLKTFTLNNADEQNKALSYAGIIQMEPMKGSTEEQEQWQKRRLEVYEGSQTHFLRSVIAGNIDENGFRVLRLLTNPSRPADSVINEKLRVFGALKKDKNYRDSLIYWTKKECLPKYANSPIYSPLTKSDLITGPDKQGIYTLNGTKGALYVTYNKYHHYNRSAMSKLSDAENTDNALLSFNYGYAHFDRNGIITDPQSLVYDGVWLRNRLPGLLPSDYEPQQDNSQPTDSTLIKRITNRLNAYTVNNITEKTYLQFDKPFYATGDTIYFKAYVTGGPKHILSQLSRVLYAQLTDEQGHVNQYIKLKLTDGLAWGDFALADTLKEGNYHISAFTNWMRNAGSEYFFKQTIPIVSTQNKKVPEGGDIYNKTATVASAKPDIQFFPEGGTLTEGLKTKIAFKAVAPDGAGIDVSGIITDNENKTVSSFTATHLGMGYTEFTPKKGKTYQAVINYTDGKSNTITLPPAQNTGYQLAIDNTTDKNNIKLNIAAVPNNNAEPIVLIGQNNGVIYYSGYITNTKRFSAIIPKSDFPTGIIQFTLFTKAGEPLNERLVFVNNNDPLKISLKTDKNSYSGRQKATISIGVKNSLNNPSTGSFSVAVTDESNVHAAEMQETSILSNLLLTSDLRGNIENPDYYFNDTNQQTEKDLDLLLMTQGYHRFEWKQVLTDSNKNLPAYQPEKNLQISGHIKSQNGKPIVGGKITLFTTTGGAFFTDTVSDNKGNFIFKNLNFNDSTKFVVQSRVAKGQDNVVLVLDSLENLPGVEINSKKATLVKVSFDMMAYRQKSKQFFDEQLKYGINKHALVLKEVVIKDKKADPLLAHSENLNGKGNADQIITSKWLETSGYLSLYDALRAKLNGVQFNFKHQLISNRTGTSLIPMKSSDYSEPRDKKGSYQDLIEIVVDGSPVTQPRVEGQPNILEFLSTNEVESVEMLNVHYAAMYGSRGSGGVLVITTKRAKNQNNYYRYAPGVITYMPKGFYKAREFYSPQYDNPKTNQKMADLRSTIYWQPNILTDSDGKASFSFFNADGKGTYRVVIEGIDTDGNLGRQIFRYKVE